jgi:hypothetical protein
MFEKIQVVLDWLKNEIYPCAFSDVKVRKLKKRLWKSGPRNIMSPPPVPGYIYQGKYSDITVGDAEAFVCKTLDYETAETIGETINTFPIIAQILIDINEFYITNPDSKMSKKRFLEIAEKSFISPPRPIYCDLDIATEDAEIEDESE